MTGDPKRDDRATPHDFESLPVDEYAQHQREQREAEQKERMDAAHEAAKAERPTLVWCKHMDMDIYAGTCAMCTPPEQEPTRGHAVAYTDARYDGACPACERGVREGDPLALIDGEWMHREHAEAGDG